MKRLLAAVLILLTAAPFAAAESRLDDPDAVGLSQRVVGGLSGKPGGDYYGTRTEAFSPLGHTGMYHLSARLKTFAPRQSAKNTFQEYSAGLTRELYHATVKGRLGTAPPDLKYPAKVKNISLNDQIRPSYHFVQGEAVLTFYGLFLGAEHPALTNVVWESSGIPPSPESLDRVWVTTVHGSYANTNHHILQPASVFVVVQNTCQFELRETWNQRTSVAGEFGFDRYNRLLPNNAQTVFLDNTEYWGNYEGAILGWPNNHESIQVWQKFPGDLKATAEATRLNLLNNELNFLYGGGLDWDVTRNLRLGVRYSYNRRRRTSVRKLLALEASYAW